MLLSRRLRIENWNTHTQTLACMSETNISTKTWKCLSGTGRTVTIPGSERNKCLPDVNPKDCQGRTRGHRNSRAVENSAPIGSRECLSGGRKYPQEERGLVRESHKFAFCCGMNCALPRNRTRSREPVWIEGVCRCPQVELILDESRPWSKDLLMKNKPRKGDTERRKRMPWDGRNTLGVKTLEPKDSKACPQPAAVTELGMLTHKYLQGELTLTTPLTFSYLHLQNFSFPTTKSASLLH